jgi:uncharacterized small protein (DUF1192 family)
MTPLPGTPPLSEREGWLLLVAELLERIAALEAEVASERERRQREDVAHMKAMGEVDE